MVTHLSDPIEILEHALSEAGFTATQLKQNLGTALRNLPKVGVSVVTKHRQVEAVLITPELLNALVAEVRGSREARMKELANIYDSRVAAMSSEVNIRATEKLLGFTI